jgi:hypothetical protein
MIRNELIVATETINKLNKQEILLREQLQEVEVLALSEHKSYEEEIQLVKCRLQG